MYGATLISSIWKDFRNGLQHTKIFITDDQTYTSKSACFQPYEERTPALTILFHALSSTEDFTAAILADADCNQNRNILDLAAPAALQVDTIYINIGIFPGKRTGTPGFDMLIWELSVPRLLPLYEDSAYNARNDIPDVPESVGTFVH